MADILELVSQMRNARADAGIEPATWLEAEVRFEAAGHAEAFRALKCEYAQGFHYAAPVPAEEAGDMLRAGFDV